MRVPDLLHAAFHRPSTLVYQRVQGLIGLMIVLSVLLLFVELSQPVPRAPWVAALDQALLGLFGVEIVLRVASWRPPALTFYRLGAIGRLWAHVAGRIRYCLRPMVLIDLLTVASAIPALRGLRGCCGCCGRGGCCGTRTRSRASPGPSKRAGCCSPSGCPCSARRC